MPNPQSNQPTQRIPLRLWPGVALAIAVLLLRFVVPAVMPGAGMYAMMGALAGSVFIVVWWLFFSRARWIERLGGLALTTVALWATSKIVHVSIATGGMGMLYFILAIPAVAIALVAWAAFTRNLPDKIRRATMVAAILTACGGWTLVRTGGFTGEGENDLAWRWSQTPEDLLLAKAGDVSKEPSTTRELIEVAPGWPGFRGFGRDGIVHGAKIKTDWSASPPVELWRRPVGPGWSSFAVLGNVFYTQEQRGDDEVVSCYDLATGEPVWRHSDSTRFWESNAGAGPRGTPTVSDGCVYTFGATGILNVLNADDGSVVWSRNAASDTGMKVPMWGFSSSPLVVDDLVIVAASGALVAYDLASGELRWSGPASGEGYSSPQLLSIDGVTQVVQLNGDGAFSVSPADGTQLWNYPWPGYPIVQPTLTPDGDVLVTVNQGAGLRSLTVKHDPGGWIVDEQWRSNRLKPYYSDIVVHEGHAYGFDGSVVVCINLEDGNRTWKGGRYGAGQLFLLADQSLLVVLGEEGELALVAASPDGFTELATFPAIEGKTWNHPVLVGDLLLVRNAEEMAAFKLTLAGG